MLNRSAAKRIGKIILFETHSIALHNSCNMNFPPANSCNQISFGASPLANILITAMHQQQTKT